MVFFASPRTAREQVSKSAPVAFRRARGVLFTSNTERARLQGLRATSSRKPLTARVVLGELINVQATVGGREPPRRNPSCYS